MPARQSSDYKRGYSSGYAAGLRHRAVTYRKQAWRCFSCEATGMVLFHSDDDEPQKRARIEMSHRAQRNVKRCPHPRLTRLTQRETERIKRPTPPTQEGPQS